MTIAGWIAQVVQTPEENLVGYFTNRSKLSPVPESMMKIIVQELSNVDFISTTTTVS